MTETRPHYGRPQAPISNVYMAVYRAIVQHKLAHDGNSPSMRELCEQFRKSTSAMSYILDRLETEGWIQREKNHSRSICIPGGKWTHGG